MVIPKFKQLSDNGQLLVDSNDEGLISNTNDKSDNFYEGGTSKWRVINTHIATNGVNVELFFFRFTHQLT